MKKLTYTKKEAIKEHRKMWRWLARNPHKIKAHYFATFIEKEVERDCFLCHYSFEKNNNFCVTNCILIWPGGECMARNSPYLNWKDAVTSKAKRRYALQIANLPERKKTSTRKATSIRPLQDNGYATQTVRNRQAVSLRPTKDKRPGSATVV